MWIWVRISVSSRSQPGKAMNRVPITIIIHLVWMKVCTYM